MRTAASSASMNRRIPREVENFAFSSGASVVPWSAVELPVHALVVQIQIITVVPDFLRVEISMWKIIKAVCLSVKLL
jgi:hypothetical protein